MKSIILIGYMGSGKSSAARALSDKLGIPVMDTDAHIEADEGMKISDIFDRFGEDRFRDMETELLHSLIKERKVQVVSTGGGMPVREENRKLLKDLGSVVYLKASPEQIAKRLENDTTRPLLAGTTVLREKIERIEAMLKLRSRAYEGCADIIVDTDGVSVDEVVSRIISELSL